LVVVTILLAVGDSRQQSVSDRRWLRRRTIQFW